MLLIKIKRPLTAAQRKSKILILSAVLALIISLTTTIAIAAASIITTTIEYDGVSVTVSAFTSDPYTIVEKAGVVLSEGDIIGLERFNQDTDEKVITVSRAYDVIINDDKKPPVTYRVCGTVADAIEKAGIKLNEADTLNYSLDTVINGNIAVVITRSFNVKVTVDGNSKQYDITKGTVGELLKKISVTVSENDTLNHELSEKVMPGMEIKVGRVTFENITETEEIDYETEEKETDKLYSGQTQIGRKGVKGERTNYYSLRYIDGEIADKQLVMTKVTKAPVNELIFKGTGKKPVFGSVSHSSSGVISELTPPYEIKLDSNGRPVNYKKRIIGQATAYSNDPITATGQKTMPGRIAVNPKQIPYGTKMYIVSCDGKYVYGYCEASDTGGFVNKTKAIADLYFNTEEECRQFGRRDIEIYILE